ncbi:hypothetical protein K469DRAFT_544300, partial [Zopfia rhizophila CBS 207.26]
IQILVGHMKKRKHYCETATNGLEALQAHNNAAGKIACILMDMCFFPLSHAIPTALKTRMASKLTVIITLTGLATASAQKEAYASGIDIFFKQLVKLKEVKALFSQIRNQNASAATCQRPEG